MTKQDFELIARVLRQNGPDQQFELDRLAGAFASALAATNSRFARDRFIAACMGEDSHDSAGRRVRYTRGM